jgi:hypothetical protein
MFQLDPSPPPPLITTLALAARFVSLVATYRDLVPKNQLLGDHVAPFLGVTLPVLVENDSAPATLFQQEQQLTHVVSARLISDWLCERVKPRLERNNLQCLAVAIAHVGGAFLLLLPGVTALTTHKQTPTNVSSTTKCTCGATRTCPKPRPPSVALSARSLT